MNGRALIYGALAAFTAAQASALAIDNLTVRAVVQAGIGLAMFVAGVYVSPRDVKSLTGRHPAPKDPP